MACGMPIISVNLPPQRPYIKNGINGILIEPEDPKELARHINAILEDKEKGKRMAKCSRDILLERGYYAEKEMPQLIEFYERIVKN